MGALTLSAEPWPVYSILCDSPTHFALSAKAALYTELDFKNLSSENSREIQKGRVWAGLSRYPGDGIHPRAVAALLNPVGSKQPKALPVKKDKRQECVDINEGEA